MLLILNKYYIGDIYIYTMSILFILCKSYILIFGFDINVGSDLINMKKKRQDFHIEVLGR